MAIRQVGSAILLMAMTAIPVISQTSGSSPLLATAPVEGIVVNKNDGSPLASATVVLTSNSAQNTQYRLITNLDGTFAFKNIPAGRYNLNAELRGYLQPNLAERISSIEVPGKQAVRKLRIQLLAQASVSGRLTDDRGPLAGATVYVLRFEYDKNGSLGLQPPTGAASGSRFTSRTDEKGEYQISPLVPGEYLLWVTPDDHQSFYPMYYPGVTDPQSAARLSLTPGVELNHTDWHVVTGKRYSIRVTPSIPFPISAPVSFQLRSRGSIREQNLLTSNSVLRNAKDGSYTIKEIPPGSYDIFMSTGARGVSQKLSVEITDSDLDLGVVPIKRGISITGTVKFGGTPVTTTVGIDPFPILEGLPKSAVLREDGTFRLDDVSEGQYRIFVRTAKNDQYIVSARLGSLDVLASGMAVDSSQALPQLEIQLESPPGLVEGIMQNKKGDPIRGARVVVFPLSGPRANPDVFHAASTDQEGHFLIEGIPPGNYGVLGWEYLPGEAYKNAEFLKTYEALAAKVTVVSGATRRVNIYD